MKSEPEAVPRKRQFGEVGVGGFLHTSRLRGRTADSLEAKGEKQEACRFSPAAAARGQAAGPPGGCGSEPGRGGDWEGELDTDHSSESRVASGLLRDLEGICK